MAHADVEALERGYAALNRGDLSVVLELLDADIEWHEPGWSPEAGTHRGRDSFERFLRGWVESFEEFRVEPERVVQRGDRLVAVVRQTGAGRSSGVHVGTRIAHVWTVVDGRAVRWESVPEPETVLDGVR
ncbi:MAG TPA: nuclear transport factor 2 family protein [Thermoleophilaceae bacterium]|nr:nuclear transport factor 2 family protein [Thermoleophilaceae bacterium]